ncbi:zinc-ribbon domain-containing protein [Terrisporobacter mayombei]|uniref:Zinc-ribbon domain-containing protein n=1 Tax=Terrisporobacter mayombei TaxID=1541 RepID=A0ABY9PZY5_9FIRM|nr:zinc-ribbon domain-containing protein [Terrisporobacter mayombei]MCC3866583.1 DUF2628 domain-containing protein [Terrisporobacter mayombei]WMT80818.1 hypothetical protein TEMA_11400 [Terrisporobacter mayombei]
MQSTDSGVVFCTECGKENQATSSFCNSCGKPLKKVELSKNNSQGENSRSSYSSADCSEEEMNTFISKNQMFYLEKFDQIRMTGDKKTWNWSAFLAGAYWMFYRKMYVQGILYFLASLLLSFVPVIGWVLDICLWVGVGTFANSLYLDHINKKFQEINCADSSYRQALINKNGGTNIVLPIVLLLIPAIIAIILLFLSVVIFGSMFGAMSYYY